MPNASQSARARVRDQLTSEIKAAAAAALARDGAAGLSLRAVARDLGMAPSALYRYFAGRDELLTELIVGAYDALADDMEAAVAAVGGDGDGDGERWVAAAVALRQWASGRSHEWALLYGSPVPGYHAPQRTVPAALRVPRTFVAVVETAAGGDRLAPPLDPPPPPSVAAAVAPIATGLPTTLPPALIVATLAAWEQLAGAVSLELFGHLTGGIEDPDAVYAHLAVTTARRVGLAPIRNGRHG